MQCDCDVADVKVGDELLVDGGMVRFIRGGFALVNLECSNLIWSIAHVGRVDTALMLLLDTATIYQLKRLEILFFLKKKKISISSLF